MPWSVRLRTSSLTGPSPAVAGGLVHLGAANYRSPTLNPYIAQFTLVFLEILTWAIIARSLLSWFPIDQSSPLFQLLHRVTDPIIDPLRKLMPNTGMMDLSPMAAIIMLIVLRQLVVGVAQPL